MTYSRVLSIAALCAAACFVPAAGADTAKAVAAVHLKDSTFAPAELRVRTGDAVDFVNDDGFGHTVTAADGSFDSKDIAAGKTWRYTFSKAGTYALVCTYHSWMKASVVVTEP